MKIQKRRVAMTESRQHGGLQIRKMRNNQRRKWRCVHGALGEGVALKLIENVFLGGGKCQMLVKGKAIVYLTVSMVKEINVKACI